MQVSKTALAAVAALSLVVTSARAQVQVFSGPDPDRKSSTVVMFGQNIMAGVSISYSAPEWQAAYDKAGALDKFKGKNVRLGKNWWTSLDTNIPLEIAGTKIAPGAYVLGMRYTEDGKFKLLVIDAGKAMKHSMMPFAPDGWKDETAVIDLKLTKNALEETKERMEIAIAADESDHTRGSFSVQWGKHELSADVKFVVAGPKPASAKKKGDAKDK